VNENELLAQATDPEKTYIEQIMPSKLRLNQKYILKNNIGIDLKIIVQTIFKIIF
jgi:lipopolysaccharide/colanic/teichoic acid biosynthesis glycosyltransferase